MPIPASQGCHNCQYWDTASGSPAPGTEGRCLYNFPAFGTPNWVNVKFEDWCQFWAAIGSASGGSGLLPTDAGIGLRGTSDTGASVALTTAWTLLQPAWAAVTNAVNFDSPATGTVRLNYTTYTPSPTFVTYAQANGIVTFTSGSNNEDMEITFGVNGTAIEDYKVRVGFKNTGVSVAVPIVAGLSLANQDQISIHARSPTTVTATYRDYHLLLEAFKVLTF